LEQFPKCHKEIPLGDFNAKLGREDILKPTNGEESLHKINNDTEVIVVNLPHKEILIVKNTVFPHNKFHKHTCSSPDGKMHHQIDYILIEKSRHSSIYFTSNL
jgi:hypothetical protein